MFLATLEALTTEEVVVVTIPVATILEEDPRSAVVGIEPQRQRNRPPHLVEDSLASSMV